MFESTANVDDKEVYVAGSPVILVQAKSAILAFVIVLLVILLPLMSTILEFDIVLSSIFVPLRVLSVKFASVHIFAARVTSTYVLSTNHKLEMLVYVRESEYPNVQPDPVPASRSKVSTPPNESFDADIVPA